MAGLRYFAVLQGDQIVRLPMTKVNRLGRLADKDENLFPEFAGQRIRVASLYYETQSRKPTRILREEYSVIEFNASGQQAELRYNPLDCLDGDRPDKEDRAKGLLPGRARFREKTEELYRWKPSDEIRQKLFALVFKSGVA